jgi:hypothetical protein
MLYLECNGDGLTVFRVYLGKPHPWVLALSPHRRSSSPPQNLLSAQPPQALVISGSQVVA